MTAITFSELHELEKLGGQIQSLSQCTHIGTVNQRPVWMWYHAAEVRANAERILAIVGDGSQAIAVEKKP